MSEWKLTERELGEAIFAAYKRGFRWAEENGFNEEYLNKAASDYTDGTLYEMSNSAASKAKPSQGDGNR